MKDNYEKFLDVKIHIIEAFIEEYGEEFRDIIETKIDNVNLIFYNTHSTRKDEIRRSLDKINKKFSKLIANSFKEKFDIDIINDENAKELFFPHSDCLRRDYTPFNYVTKLIEHKSEYVENGLPKYLKEKIEKVFNYFGWEIDVQGSDKEILDNFDTHISSLKPIVDVKSLYISEYNNLTKSLYDESEKIYKIMAPINNKRKEYTLLWYKEFLSKFPDFVSEVDKEKINNSLRDLLTFTNVNSIIGSLITSSSVFLSFSSENRAKLIDENISESIKNKILYNQNKVKEYFKKINPDKDFVFPDSELVDEFLKSRVDYSDEYNKFLVENDPYIQDLINIVDKNNFLSTIDASKYGLDTGSRVVPNVSLIDGKKVINNPVFLNLSTSMYEYSDVYFLHELTHFIETNFVNEDEGYFNFTVGFEEIHQEKPGYADREDEREYTLINEIRTQKIAMSVAERLHEKDIYIFNDKDNAQIKGSTKYEESNRFFNQLYKEYKKEMNSAGICGDLNIIANKIGRDNFDKFANVINEFGAMSRFKLSYDLRNKVDSKEVDKFNDLNKAYSDTLKKVNEKNTKIA